jgi:hypothetical protein
MKVGCILVRIYEYGDKVETLDGEDAIVIHDELDGVESENMNQAFLSGKEMDEVCDNIQCRMGITIRYLEDSEKHNANEETVVGRESLTLKEESHEV